MPTPTAKPELEGFDLAGMAELATKVQPGLDLEETPESPGRRQAAIDEGKAQKELEAGAGEETEEQKTAREAEEAAAEAGGEGEETAEEKTTREAEEARVAAETGEGEETEEQKTAREKTEKEAADKAAGEDPDSDLAKKAAEIEPHTTKKTRATIKFFQEEAKKARGQRREQETARVKAEKDLADALEKAKTGAIPKEVTEELAQLRAKIQELDAGQDPEIVRKFDKPIERNTNAVIGILKNFKYDKNEDGTENLRAIPDLIKKGLSLSNPEVRKIIETLEKNELFDEAESIRDAIRENGRLSRDRSAEVESIKSTAGDRVAQRTKAQQDSASEFDRQTIAQAGPILAADLEALQKEFSYLKRPAEPLATDSAEVAKVKRDRIAEFDAAEVKVGELAKSFSTDGKTREEQIKSRARMAAYAIKSAVLQERLVPRLKRDLKVKTDRVLQLEAELAKHKKASDLSKAHSAGVGGGGKSPAESSKGASTADAMTEFFRSQGVEV